MIEFTLTIAEGNGGKVYTRIQYGTTEGDLSSKEMEVASVLAIRLGRMVKEFQAQHSAEQDFYEGLLKDKELEKFIGTDKKKLNKKKSRKESDEKKAPVIKPDKVD